MYEILDIGCGKNPQGDINIDYLAYADKYRIADLKNVPNFLNADVQNLPFRDNVVSKVIMVHVLEHLDNPLKALREVRRVVMNEATIFVPNYPLEKETQYHFYSWNRWTLYNILNKAGFTQIAVTQLTRMDALTRITHLLKRSRIFYPLGMWLSDYARHHLKDELKAICRK
jgi:ubiquinone/menaquinone biosynthesis C-methylase UbiE